MAKTRKLARLSSRLVHRLRKEFGETRLTSIGTIANSTTFVEVVVVILVVVVVDTNIPPARRFLVIQSISAVDDLVNLFQFLSDVLFGGLKNEATSLPQTQAHAVPLNNPLLPGCKEEEEEDKDKELSLCSQRHTLLSFRTKEWIMCS